MPNVPRDGRALGRLRAPLDRSLPSRRSVNAARDRNLRTWSNLRSPWLALGVSAVLGCLSATELAPALLVWGLYQLLLGLRLPVVLLGLLGFVASGFQARQAVQDFSEARSRGREEVGGPLRCAVEGVVEASPVFHTAESGDLEPTLAVRAERGACEGHRLTPGTRLRVSGRTPWTQGQVGRGDRVALLAQLAPVRAFHNAGLPDPTPWLALRGAVLTGGLLALEVRQPGRGILRFIDEKRAHVRERISKTYAPGAAGLARALVLGETDLTDQDSVAFRQSGLLHLLAVSGTHLVIAVLALVRGLRAVLVRIPWLAGRYDVTRFPAAVGCLLSVLYADFSGRSGSAIRAACMLLLLLGARVLGRRLSGLSALGGSLLLGVAVFPLLGCDFSFLLSALATLGLLLVGQPLARMLRRGAFSRAPLSQLVEGVSATVSATACCAPLLSLISPEMTPKAIIANLVAAPLGELLALPACLLHAVASSLPTAELGLSVVGSWALLLVRRVAHVTVGTPGGSFRLGLPDPWQLAWVTSLALLALRFWLLPPRFTSMGAKAAGSPTRRTVLDSSGNLPARFPVAWFPAGARALGRFGVTRATVQRVLGLILLVLVSFAVRPMSASSASVRFTTDALARRPPLLSVTALDVGQGDALLLDFPDGKVALVDGGGFAVGKPDTAERVLLPALRARGKEAVDLMIVSHADPDHISGLLGVAELLPVRELWHPESPVRSGTLRTLLDRVLLRGGVVRGPGQLCSSLGPRNRGARQPGVLFAGVRLRPLLPCEEDDVAPGRGPSGEPGSRPKGIAGNSWSKNDRSLVVRVEFGRRSFLLTGDVEALGEQRLLDSFPDDLSVDVLKVPHHGSDTSSSEAFLDRVRPSLAVISSGVRNRFSHPRAVVLARLAERRIATWRTDRWGSISILTDGNDLWTRTARGDGFGQTW